MCFLQSDAKIGEYLKSIALAGEKYPGKQMLDVESYNPGILSPNTTYYWRVDEVNNAHPDSPWSGGLWRFTTGDFFVIDDFENYNIDNKIWWTWKDGLGYVDHPSEPDYGGNGTGSMVGDEREASTASDFRIHRGRYSMPFWYDNNKPGLLKHSEAILTLTAPRDWTENGVNTLSLWCVSDWDWENDVSANDAELMYVVLNGSAVVYHDDPAITKVYNWTEWRIDLQEFTDLGIDLTNIQTIGLGFGNRDNPKPGGNGLVSFDDICLISSP